MECGQVFRACLSHMALSSQSLNTDSRWWPRILKTGKEAEVYKVFLSYSYSDCSHGFQTSLPLRIHCQIEAGRCGWNVFHRVREGNRTRCQAARQRHKLPFDPTPAPAHVKFRFLLVQARTLGRIRQESYRIHSSWYWLLHLKLTICRTSSFNLCSRFLESPTALGSQPVGHTQVIAMALCLAFLGKPYSQDIQILSNLTYAKPSISSNPGQIHPLKGRTKFGQKYVGGK